MLGVLISIAALALIGLALIGLELPRLECPGEGGEGHYASPLCSPLRC